jgi:hypothetical protein
VSLDRRQHAYDELHEIVMEIVLGAGERGLGAFQTLLEKTALELGKRDGLAAGPFPAFGPASRLHPSDTEAVLEIAWECARKGVVTFAPGETKTGSTALRRSRFSEQALRRSPERERPERGFLKTWRLDELGVSERAAVYLREAISAFYMDCLLSTCVMLAIAAEGEFLRLLSAAKASKAHGDSFSRIGDGQEIGVKIGQFQDAVRSIGGRLPKAATNELECNLATVQTVLRAARKETGTPSGARPPSRDQVYLHLQLFVPFARQALRLRQELSDASPDRRVVWLH